MSKLPFLGLGLSSNMDAAAHPLLYRMLDEEPGLFDYVEYSAPLSVETAREEASLFAEMEARRATTPVLFHPVHLNLFGPELETPRSLAELELHARAVESPWVSNDVAWWHTRGRVFPGYLYLAPPFDRASLDDVAAHALHVQAALGRPLLLENPAVLCARGDLHVVDFMNALHEETGLGLLFDAGHFYSHQLARGLPVLDGLDRLNADAIYEVHLAGGVVVTRGEQRFYLDDHPQPVRDEVLAITETLLPRARNLCALTFEGDGQSEGAASSMLKQLRPWVARMRHDGVDAPVPKTSVRSPDLLLMATRAQQLYDEVHASENFERDFRLEVIAERLDKHMPLTRALYATQLPRFLASEELREKPLLEAFRTFIRRRLIHQHDESLAAVVAAETIGRDRFPRDLSGLDAALVALRRRRLSPADLAEAMSQVVHRVLGSWLAADD